MTIQYRPSSHPADETAQAHAPEASPMTYGQVSPEQLLSSPNPNNQTCPKISPENSPSLPIPNDQPPNAFLEATPTPYGQVSPEQLPSSPTPNNQTCPDTCPTLNLPNPSPDANYDYIHHILIGSPQGVIDAINRLHLGHPIERHRWTPLIAVRDAGIHITPAQGQVISYLIQQRAV
ncbi:MAG: hypothetical protein WBA10_15785 [Elainellaceae cyanobacterium]